MPKKAIETQQEFIVVCDNPSCDYKVENKEGTFTGMEDYDEYLNKPCPKCGENLLTEEDYRTTKAVFELVDLVNKVFTDFEEDAPRVTLGVKIHKGIHITEKDN